jgi:hypothetical protein
MCPNCFEEEISSFSSEREWQSFDLLLTKKLGGNKMKKVEFRPDGERDKDDGEYIYKCLTCGERWRLKEPDYSFRGYFLKEQ